MVLSVRFIYKGLLSRITPFLFIAAIILTCFSAAGCLDQLSSLIEFEEDTAGFTKILITRVVDGDTAYALLPDGSEERVRFIGVDAPEINHPTLGLELYGPEAKEFTSLEIEGKELFLEFDENDRDQYGRLLAYLWFAVPEVITDQSIRQDMFNARLLLEGFAVQVVFMPNNRYADLFAGYEEEAREKGRGMWQEDGAQ